MRGHKYKAVRTGHFASKLENAVFDMLKWREKAGDIKEVQCQATVHLVGGIDWKIDFSYIDVKTDKLVYTEAKGIETEGYRLKLRLYKYCIKNKLEIYKGSWKSPKLVKTING